MIGTIKITKNVPTRKIKIVIWLISLTFASIFIRQDIMTDAGFRIPSYYMLVDYMFSFMIFLVVFNIARVGISAALHLAPGGLGNIVDTLFKIIQLGFFVFGLAIFAQVFMNTFFTQTGGMKELGITSGNVPREIAACYGTSGRQMYFRVSPNFPNLEDTIMLYACKGYCLVENFPVVGQLMGFLRNVIGWINNLLRGATNNIPNWLWGILPPLISGITAVIAFLTGHFVIGTLSALSTIGYLLGATQMGGGNPIQGIQTLGGIVRTLVNLFLGLVFGFGRCNCRYYEWLMRP